MRSLGAWKLENSDYVLNHNEDYYVIANQIEFEYVTVEYNNSLSSNFLWEVLEKHYFSSALCNTMMIRMKHGTKVSANMLYSSGIYLQQYSI